MDEFPAAMFDRIVGLESELAAEGVALMLDKSP